MKKFFVGVFGVALLLVLISYAFLSVEGPDVVSSPDLEIAADSAPGPQKHQKITEQGVPAVNQSVEIGVVEVDRRQASRLPETDVTPSESGLLSGGGLSVPAVENILGSDEYDEFIQNFAREVAPNPDALDLTHLYASAAKKLLVGDDARLISLHCGTTLCAGQIRSSSRASFEAWVAAFAEHKATPYYGFANRSVNVGIDDYEHRFIFSTDPAANAVTVPMHWVPKKGSGP